MQATQTRIVFLNALMNATPARLEFEYSLTSQDDPLTEGKSPWFPFDVVPVTRNPLFVLECHTPGKKLHAVQGQSLPQGHGGVTHNLPSFAPEIVGNSWVWKFTFVVDAGAKIKVLVNLEDTYQLSNGPKKSPKIPELRQDVFGGPGGQMNASTPSGVELPAWEPPRLVLGLTEAPVPKQLETTFSPLTEVHLGKVLTYLYQRLNMGLAEAWKQQDRRYDRKSIEALELELQQNYSPVLEHHIAEESWARAYSELLTLTSYGGSGQASYDSGTKDMLLYDHMQSHPEPFVPIIASCQHLAQMGVMSRGIRFDFFDKDANGKIRLNEKGGYKTLGTYPINAGSASAATIQRVGGRWFLEPDKPLHIKGRDRQDKYKTPVATGIYQEIEVGSLKTMRSNPALQNPMVVTPIDIDVMDAVAGNEHIQFGPGAIWTWANKVVQYANLQIAQIVGQNADDTPILETNSPDISEELRKKLESPNTLEELQKVPGYVITKGGSSTGVSSILYQMGKTDVAGLGPDYELHADNQSGAHAVFVMRVDTSDPNEARFQLFDTGGMAREHREEPPINDGLYGSFDIHNAGGNLEDTWIRGYKTTTYTKTNPPQQVTQLEHTLWPGSAPMKGMGIVPTRTVSQLREAAARLRKTRPLGMARVILMKRGWPKNKVAYYNDAYGQEVLDKWLVFASPLMRMYEEAPLQNFPLARFAWAVREMPGMKDLEAIMLFDVPRKELATAFLECSRSCNMAAVVKRAQANMAEKIRSAAYVHEAGLFGKPPAKWNLELASVYRKRAENLETELASLSPGQFLRGAELKSIPSDKKKVVTDFLFGTKDIISTAEGGVQLAFNFKATGSKGKASILRRFPHSKLPLDKVTLGAGLSLSTLQALPDLPAYFFHEWDSKPCTCDTLIATK